MKALLSFVAVVQFVVADFAYSGCFANTGVSLAFKNLYPMNIVDQCSSICAGAKFMGVIEGSRCYCGDLAPLASPVSDGNCNTNCSGAASPSCGGNGFFAVFTDTSISTLSLSLSLTLSLSLSLSLISSLSLSLISTTDSLLSISSSSILTTTSSDLSGTITVLPSSSLTYALATDYNTTYSPTTNLTFLRHLHRSATTSLSSDETVITSNLEYVQNGLTITSAVLLTTKADEVELTRTAGNVVLSSVTVVDNKGSSVKSQVAGGVVGASAGISLICFLAWYYTRRVKQKDEEEKQRDLAIIAATMASKNPDLSHSGTVYRSNPFSPKSGSLNSKPSTKRRLDNTLLGQGQMIRMGLTGRDLMYPVRMGLTGHDDEHGSEGTLGLFTSALSDGYYAEKLTQNQAASLSRNTSSATASTGRYSFASFESNGMLVDDEIASSVARDDGSIHNYTAPTIQGLTIANPDSDSESEDEAPQNDGNSRLRVLF